MQRGKIHLPFSNKNYSYVLPLLLFDTLDLQDFRTTTRSSTRSKHRAQHIQSRQTRTTKNNTPIMKGSKREQGLVLGSRTQETLRPELWRDLNYYTQRL
jgi:hypothetical protein